VTEPLRIRIDGHDLPGRTCQPGPGLSYQNIHVGVQRRSNRDELLGLLPGDAAAASWTLECTVSPTADGTDVKGAYVQGPPGGRFIYLSWGAVNDAGMFSMFRRAKLWLDTIPPDVLRDAIDRGVLVGRVGLTDRQGNPLCASVRPPTITWSAAAS
jgi:hypothetical protein